MQINVRQDSEILMFALHGAVLVCCLSALNRERVRKQGPLATKWAFPWTLQASVWPPLFFKCHVIPPASITGEQSKMRSAHSPWTQHR